MSKSLEPPESIIVLQFPSLLVRRFAEAIAGVRIEAKSVDIGERPSPPLGVCCLLSSPFGVSVRPGDFLSASFSYEALRTNLGLIATEQS